VWNNQEFKSVRSEEGKGFIITEGEYIGVLIKLFQ